MFKFGISKIWPTVTIKKETFSIKLPEEILQEVQKMYMKEFKMTDIKWVGDKRKMKLFKHFIYENRVDKDSRNHIEIEFTKVGR